LLAGSLAMNNVMDPIWRYVQRGTMFRASQVATEVLVDAVLAPDGLEHLEDPAYADRVTAAKAGADDVALLHDWLTGFIALGAMNVVSLLLLLNVHPILAGAAIVAGAAAMTQGPIRRRALRFMDEALPGQRLAAKLSRLAVAPGAAPDIKVLGLSDWLLARYRSASDEAIAHLRRGERGPLAAGVAGGFVEAAALVGGIYFALQLARKGQLSPGDLAVAVTLLPATMESLGSWGSSTGDLARRTWSVAKLLWLLDYVPMVRPPERPMPVPRRLETGIAVQGVAFRYPSMERDSLRGVDFSLPAGRVVALVGDNGAGKTTLVKLLCRFYDPTAGSIAVDGVDLRTLDPVAWRAAIGGSFQDFARLQLVARDSIGVGHLPALADDDAVRCAAVAGGADRTIEGLSSGYATQLGRQFSGGVELSTGQWQTVAAARGSMPPVPLMVLLDEPTAALDPRAEHELFARAAERGADSRTRGAVTLLISHRFSTVRMADHIVVLDGGRTIEQGDHATLVAAGGRYASRYLLQAERYE
jgi:ATP-binding cassette subfamily B protein